MSKEERFEAEIAAGHALARGAKELDVKRKLRERYSISLGQAATIVKAVRATWDSEVEQTKAAQLAHELRGLEEAKLVAFDKGDVRGVCKVVELKGRLLGLLGSDVQLVMTPKEQGHGLEGKPRIDLEAQAIWAKDFDACEPRERAVVLEVVRGRGDKELADEVQSRMN
jgi:hypothetical protein